MTYVNLWKETISVLDGKGLTWDDVKMVWIEQDLLDRPTKMYGLTKENFEALAKDMKYDNGFGVAEVNIGLRMWGYNKDGLPFVMVRNEYDGAERWDLHILYTNLPVKEAVNLGDFPFEESE